MLRSQFTGFSDRQSPFTVNKTMQSQFTVNCLFTDHEQLKMSITNHNELKMPITCHENKYIYPTTYSKPMWVHSASVKSAQTVHCVPRNQRTVHTSCYDAQSWKQRRRPLMEEIFVTFQGTRHADVRHWTDEKNPWLLPHKLYHNWHWKIWIYYEEVRICTAQSESVLA